VEVVNGEEPKFPQEELVKDMFSILTVFSARLYGCGARSFAGR